MSAVRVGAALVCLGLAGFCVFGFLATYEPSARSFLAWRIAYAVVGAAALAGAGLAVLRR